MDQAVTDEKSAINACLDQSLSLFEPHWEKYLERLLGRGYVRQTIRYIMSCNFDFHRYLIQRRIKNFGQITPGLLGSFLRHKTDELRIRHGHAPTAKHRNSIESSIQQFLVFAFEQLGRQFRRPKKQPDCSVLPNVELDRYAAFGRQHRGLRPLTEKDNLYWIRKLRMFLKRRQVLRIEEAALADLDAFLAFHATHIGPRTMQNVIGALRGFFRYLFLTGKISSDMAAQLYSPCRFRMDSRPKYFPWHRIEQMLAAIDRSHALGKRDYAILVLLADHGLRAPEVAGLKLDDADLVDRALRLRERKNGSPDRIPISVRAAQALKDYLTVRPVSPHQEIFLSVYAPIRPLGGYVSDVAQRRLRKFFGHVFRSQGAYVLRHSFAKALLDRGAKMPDIAALLDHKSLSTTLIYTTIATEDLREVADNYANLL